MIEFTAPVGRLVWGHPLKPRAVTDRNTKQPKLNTQGQPRQAWTFGVAYDKATFQQYIWPVLCQEAATAYPATAQSNGQPTTPPKFAWKYVDGDGLDDQGKPYNLREGYAGCYVLTYGTELKAPGLFKWDGTKYNQLPADAIRTGDYVSIGATCKVNVPTDRTETPSLYINPEGVDFVGYGTEIIAQGGADPMTMFKGQQHQLPAGASATPIGQPGGVGMPGMGMQPGQPQYAPQPGYAAPASVYAPQPVMQPAPVYQQPQMMAPAQPGLPAPAPDFVANAGQPQYAPQPGYASRAAPV